MTTNYQRALDLADHIAAVNESPRELVKQLRDAGLLTPDLPEPQLGCTSDDIPYVNFEAEWWRVNAMQGEDDILIHARTPTPTISADLDEAEDLALALLAAVKWHKENDK